MLLASYFNSTRCLDVCNVVEGFGLLLVVLLVSFAAVLIVLSFYDCFV